MRFWFGGGREAELADSDRTMRRRANSASGQVKADSRARDWGASWVSRVDLHEWVAARGTVIAPPDERFAVPRRAREGSLETLTGQARSC